MEQNQFKYGNSTINQTIDILFSESPEMVASYVSGCSCIQYLGYSEHNTLLAAGGCAAPPAPTFKTEAAPNGGPVLGAATLAGV